MTSKIVKKNQNIQKNVSMNNIEKRQIQSSKLWNFIINRKEKDTTKQTHMWFGDGLDKVMFRVEDEEYDEDED
jgi:hypothetical protein